MANKEKDGAEQPVRKKPEMPVTNQIFIKTFIRTNGNNTNTTEEQRLRLKKYLLFLRLFPFIFLLVTTGFFYLLFFLSRYNFPRLILSGIFMVIFIREVSTLIFSFRMRNNILRPLEHLQQAVDEVAGGNYGYTVDDTVPTMISGLFHSFNKMSVQLKEGQAVKEKYEQNRKELIAGISHDLKTPITSILGYVEGINEGVANTEEKMQTYMDIIYKNAQYTNQLIDDLFLFSKLDINQMEYHFEPISVKDYFLDICVEKKIDLEEQGAKVVYDIDIDDAFIMAIDSKLVHRIVTNLIGNAVKYNDKQNLKLHIEVKALEGEKHGIMVRVSDNGIGIDEAHIHQIFEVFYRGDDSRSKDVGGTGLGLSISRQLVEAHGGNIWAESTPGKGTTIHFTLLDQQKEVKHG
ncbi:sensor histidine kinase [Petrocella sp. FN5]|uniref:sensor histidine kinase n=1 Tax=Petrocella sp. FN5 TaxID=3032002 RepID=UPI0023DBE098|nr:HAMP domain-containing sensor histidine kinase [Petrocella sp. FN5]MDF1616458.1 HAMP domain-containing sensor histidine kinase [Petrocella sp. FN5]